MSTMIKLIKENKVINEMINNLFDIYRIMSSRINPTYASKMIYRHFNGKNPNLDDPQTLNEKLMYLKLNKYWNNQKVSMCADKYKVREHIKQVCGPEILTKLYGAWDKASDIDWNKLPDKFVIKCNHGSGYNLVCQDKALFNIPDAINKLDKWMKERYGYDNAEQGIYNNIQRKIIAEEFIETNDGLPPKDFKFFCSNGKVLFLFVAVDRINDQVKFDYYYPDWTWIPVVNQHPNAGPMPKPVGYEAMINYAEILSVGFPMVRVDFYCENGKIYFGEMTFSHFGCFHSFDPEEYDLTFGNLLPCKKEIDEYVL